MELLVHGAMVERFERKKVDVKHRLNDLVDDLFAFMLSEVGALLPNPMPMKKLITPSSSSLSALTSVSSLFTSSSLPSPATSSTPHIVSQSIVQPPPTVIHPNTNVHQSTIIQQQQASSQAPLIIKEEFDDDDNDEQQHQNGNSNGIQPDEGGGARSIAAQPSTIVQRRSSPNPEPVIQECPSELSPPIPQILRLVPGTSTSTATPSRTSRRAILIVPVRPPEPSSPEPSCSNGSVASTSQIGLQNLSNSQLYRNSTNMNSNHHVNGNAYCCDSDPEFCQCYDCLDESMVKVEINDGPDAGSSSGDGFELNFNARSGRSTNKRKTGNKKLRTERPEPVMDFDGQGGSMEDDDDGQLMDGDDPDDEGESVPNNHQIDTLGLKCYVEGCQTMLEDRVKLNQHLFFDHDKILPYRCRVVGCGRMFDSRKDFWTHIRTGHTDYTCSICGIKFNGYFPFITHEFQLHEEGIFKCSREGCDFVAPLRDLVYKHTKTEHVKFVCNHPNCGQSFECYSYLKRHRRIHSQVKPYRCKWPACGYSSTQCGAVIQHIRIRHFKLPSSVKKQKELNIVDHRNPNDYLEVLTELLNQP